MAGQPETVALRMRLVPADRVGRKLQYPRKPAGVERRAAMPTIGKFARFAQQRKAEFQRVLLEVMGDFVEKAFRGERVDRVRTGAVAAARQHGRSEERRV